MEREAEEIGKVSLDNWKQARKSPKAQKSPRVLNIGNISSLNLDLSLYILNNQMHDQPRIWEVPPISPTAPDL